MREGVVVFVGPFGIESPTRVDPRFHEQTNAKGGRGVCGGVALRAKKGVREAF